VLGFESAHYSESCVFLANSWPFAAGAYPMALAASERRSLRRKLTLADVANFIEISLGILQLQFVWFPHSTLSNQSEQAVAIIRRYWRDEGRSEKV
jgi:hypothetical protein